VGRTYASVDAYCRLVAYLGSHGIYMELALCPGVQHSAAETDFKLERVIPMAQRLSASGPKAPNRARLDSGCGSVRMARGIEACNRAGLAQMDWLIKWNSRSTDLAPQAVRLNADSATHLEQARAGKRVTIWEQAVVVEGLQRPVRRVLGLIERSIDKRGRLQIAPELTLEGWTTSLPATLSVQTINALCADHDTHEQF
jgi:hypothetical protein